MAVKFALFSTDFGASINPWAETELMPNQVDRDFSGASAWANVDLASYDETADLSLAASGIGQYCTCPVASAPTTATKGYRLTFDVSGLVATWTVKSYAGTQTLGTVSANGAQEITWTAATTGGIRLVAVDSSSAGNFDNFSLAKIPITFIDLGEDPVHGDYDPNAGSQGRGARVPTLGGAVDQDFGSNAKDGRIRLAVSDSYLATSVMTALAAAFAAVDTQYYFTDSVNCWTVKFDKPGGFRFRRNLFFWSALATDVFGYELSLKIDSKDI